VRVVLLALRTLGWLLLTLAAASAVASSYWRLRLREHRLPGVTRLEQGVLWDKDDLYVLEGRRVLALCGWALEIAIASGVLGAGLLALPAPAGD